MVMALYPKQDDNSTVNPINIVESTISENATGEVNTDKDKKEMDVVDSRNSEHIEKKVPEELDKEPVMESQEPNGDFELGENPTVSNIADNEMTLLLDKVLQMLKIILFFNLGIGLIRFIIGIVNEDIEGLSGAISFLILSTFTLLFISVVVPFII